MEKIALSTEENKKTQISNKTSIAPQLNQEEKTEKYPKEEAAVSISKIQSKIKSKSNSQKNDSLEMKDFFLPFRLPTTSNSSLSVQYSPVAKAANFENNWKQFSIKVEETRENSYTGKLKNFKNLDKTRIKADELDEIEENKRQRGIFRQLSEIKEVSESRSSSMKDSSKMKEEKNSKNKSKFAPNIRREENQEEEIVLVESMNDSSSSSDINDSDDLSVLEEFLEEREQNLSPESSNYENSIELGILMRGLNNDRNNRNVRNNESGEESISILEENQNQNEEKTFNCCFSLFTSKDLESKTDKKNIENRIDVEFLRFAEPCKRTLRSGSLDTSLLQINKKKIKKKLKAKKRIFSCKNLNRNSVRENSEKTEVEAKKEKVEFQDDVIDLKKFMGEDEICILCNKKLKCGLYVTCYELCDHFFHEECLMDKVVQKWVGLGGNNSFILTCPRCCGVDKWRKIFEDF